MSENASGVASVGGALATCDNPEAIPAYRLSYPADWFVLPADPEKGVQPCSYFGPAPFEYRVPDRIQGDDVPWSIHVSVTSSCVIVEFPPVSTRSDIVDGFPAQVSEIAVYRDVRYYHWIIDLLPARDCDQRRQVFIQTATWQPGDYETNKQVIDLMVSTLGILTD